MIADENDIDAIAMGMRDQSPAAFIALKLEAFNDRGAGDVLGSHDIEDIAALIASRATIVGDVETAHPEIRERVQRFARSLVASGVMDDVLAAHLNNADDPEFAVVITRERIAAFALPIVTRPE